MFAAKGSKQNKIRYLPKLDHLATKLHIAAYWDSRHSFSIATIARVLGSKVKQDNMSAN